MADALKDVLVNSRGGLYTNEDTLTLANTLPGSAIRMLNMEVSQFGGYRRINGYADYDSNYGSVTGSGPVMGLWILYPCLLYTSPSPRDGLLSRMPSSA